MKAKEKDPMTSILDNQKALMDTLVKNTNAVLDLYKVKDVPGGAAIEDLQKDTQAYIKDVLKPENSSKFVEELPKNLAKAVEIQSKFYQASMDSVINFWKGFESNAFQKKMETVNKLYQENTKAILETTNKNFQSITNIK